jgi:hypothetical protein
MSSNPYEVIRPSRGASLQEGKAYHDIPGVEGPSYRSGSAARSVQIATAVTVDKKTGLDLGCSVGGVSFGLATMGATMHGFDLDGSAVAVGQQHAINSGLPVILNTADASTVDAILIPGMYDFCVWLANWMWIATDGGYDYACNMLRKVSDVIPVLFFETAQASGSQAGNHGINSVQDVIDLVRSNTTYSSVVDLGESADGWHGRNLLKCSR